MCVVTRERREPDELLRLVASPDGVLLVDYRGRLPGRGAWVTATRDCVERLEAKPGLLVRALRGRVDCDGLLTKARESTLKAVIDALTLAARAGGLVGGKDGVRSAIASGGSIGVVLAEDTSPRLVADLRRRAEPLPVFTLPLDTVALGGRIGKGPRAALAIRSGNPGKRLVRELRRLEALR